MIYLDANAAEVPRPEARSAVLAALDLAGNPSSVHQSGRAANRMLEQARETVARCFGALPNQVVFTSGGTEADATAVWGLGHGRRLIIGATEHDAIRSAAAGALVLPVCANGVIDLDALRQLLSAEGPALVCVMLANNETGTIQPIPEIARLCRAAGALLHVDAVQGPGRIAVDLAALGAHSLALSAHKLGGPKGVGALLLAPEMNSCPALIAGGGQERGRRGGTPPLPAIAGFAACVEAMGPARDLSPMRDRIERHAAASGARIIGGGARRLGNTTCLALPGVRADAQVIALDLAGFAVSAGAACSSGKVTESHVLKAMGYGTLAGQAIRVSLPWNVTETEVSCFVTAYAEIAQRLRHAAGLTVRAA